MGLAAAAVTFPGRSFRGRLVQGRAVPGGRVHETREQAQVVVLFGVPLHGHPERNVGQFHGLHDPVPAARRHGEAGADPVDGLVVVDGNGKGDIEGVQQPVQPRVRFHVHVHDVEDAVAGLVAAVADDVRQVLVQGAAERDVEHLGAAADAEQGQLPVEGPVDQLVLPGIAIQPRLVGFRVGGLAVARPYRSPWGVPGAVIAGILSLAIFFGFFINEPARPAIAAIAVVYVVMLLIFALYGRKRLVLSPEEEYAVSGGLHGDPQKEGYGGTVEEQLLALDGRDQPAP